MARRKATVEPRHLLAVLVMVPVCFALMGLLVLAGKGAIVGGVAALVIAAVVTSALILKRRRETARRMEAILNEPSASPTPPHRG
jgi:hypothetical protein